MKKVRCVVSLALACSMTVAAASALAQTTGRATAVSPIVPGGGFVGVFGQPIRGVGNIYSPFFGTGPLGNLAGATGPLSQGSQFIGPLSQLSAAQQMLPFPAAGQGPFGTPLGGINLLSNQAIFNGGSTRPPIVPTVNSPLILSAGGPGYGYNPAIGYGGPVYPGYGYYGPQGGNYTGGIPGMANGATVNTASYGGGLTGSTPIARTSEWIDARMLSSNRIEVAWHGDARAVSQVTFNLLDKNRKPIRQHLVKRVPAIATLALTNQTAYYQVIVQYVNGTTTSVVSPL